MQRQRIDFDEFKKSFINQPDGLFPAHSSFKEDYEGNVLRVLQIDLICEWRLTDGKTMFVEVPFQTQGQLAELLAYLRLATGLLNKAILDNIDELQPFNETTPEADAVPWPKRDDELSNETLEEIRKKTAQYQSRLIYEALRELPKFKNS